MLVCCDTNLAAEFLCHPRFPVSTDSARILFRGKYSWPFHDLACRRPRHAGGRRDATGCSAGPIPVGARPAEANSTARHRRSCSIQHRPTNKHLTMRAALYTSKYSGLPPEAEQAPMTPHSCYMVLSSCRADRPPAAAALQIQLANGHFGLRRTPSLRSCRWSNPLLTASCTHRAEGRDS